MREELAKVHVGNLLDSVTDPDLYDTFEKFGSISYVSIIKERESGESRGFAFIQFESETSAEDAITAASEKAGLSVKGQECTVELSRPKRSGSRGRPRGRSSFEGRRDRYNERDRRDDYDDDRYYGGNPRYDDDPRDRPRYSRRGSDSHYGSSYGSRNRGYGRKVGYEHEDRSRHEGYRPRGSGRY